MANSFDVLQNKAAGPIIHLIPAFMLDYINQIQIHACG